jgi:hypothetical protein
MDVVSLAKYDCKPLTINGNMALDKSIFKHVAAHLPLSQLYSYVIRCIETDNTNGVRTVCRTGLLDPLSILIACLNGLSSDCVKVAAYYCRDKSYPKLPVRMNFSDVTIVNLLYRKFGMHVRCDNIVLVLDEIKELREKSKNVLGNIHKCVHTILYEYRLKTGRSIQDVGVAHDSLEKISDLGGCNMYILSSDRRFGKETYTDLTLAVRHNRMDVVENLLSRDYPDFGNWVTCCPETVRDSIFTIGKEFGPMVYESIVAGGMDPNSLKISRKWVPREIDLAFMIMFWTPDQISEYEKYFMKRLVEVSPNDALTYSYMPKWILWNRGFKYPIDPRNSELIASACLLCNKIDVVRKYLSMINAKQLNIDKIQVSGLAFLQMSVPFAKELCSENLIFMKEQGKFITGSLATRARYDLIEALGLEEAHDIRYDSFNIPNSKYIKDKDCEMRPAGWMFLCSFCTDPDMMLWFIKYKRELVHDIMYKYEVRDKIYGCLEGDDEYCSDHILCSPCKYNVIEEQDGPRELSSCGARYSISRTILNRYWKKVRMSVSIRVSPPFNYQQEWMSYYIVSDFF